MVDYEETNIKSQNFNKSLKRSKEIIEELKKIDKDPNYFPNDFYPFSKLDRQIMIEFAYLKRALDNPNENRELSLKIINKFDLELKLIERTDFNRYALSDKGFIIWVTFLKRFKSIDEFKNLSFGGLDPIIKLFKVLKTS